MKILLIGEYSSFHKFLKEGLEQNGHEVYLASDGDGWKKISGADIPLYYEKKYKSKLLSKIMIIKSSIKCSKQLKSFDVIQLINPIIYHYSINTFLIKRIKNQNNKLLSLACVGYDSALYKAYHDKCFDYYIDDFDNESVWGNRGLIGKIIRKSDEKIVELSDVIVPGLYEYSVGYKNNSKLTNVIPMPVNLDTIVYEENKVGDRVVFFHGLNRENAKGTKYIRKAFEIIKEKYGDEVEMIIDGHIPFDQYIHLLNRANVIVDQCCCYGYGINALISLAKGKVVIAGAHKDTISAFNINECPIFHATPSVDYLVEQISYIIDHKEFITDWGRKSREYVENIHDCKVVARQYISLWKRKLEKQNLYLK